MKNSNAVGEMTEAIVLARLIRLGFVVLMPFGNNQRYDLVADKGDGIFIRGQCKTARRSQNGCILFNTSSVNGFTGKKTSYHGQADVFWVYSPDTDLVYEVPVKDAGNSQCWLRISPAGGGPTAKIRWAKDFVL